LLLQETFPSSQPCFSQRWFSEAKGKYRLRKFDAFQILGIF
jgi:hypothetical protein